jgi:uncharacterized membrane protein
MLSIDVTAIASDPATVYRLAADIERWPALLPHYRWVRVLEDLAPYERLVEMAARRGAIPVKWQAIQCCFPHERRIYYKHIGGITTGMDVEWTIRPAAGLTRARITHQFRPPWPVLGPFIANAIMAEQFISPIAQRTLAGIKEAAEKAFSGVRD